MKYVVVLFLGLSSLSLISCSDTTLVAPSDKVSVAAALGQYCTLNVTTTPGIKFFFVIDTTGSNAEGDTTTTGISVPPTDPTRALRLSAMNSIAQAYPGALYALRTFAENSNGGLSSVYFPFVNETDFVNASIPGFQQTTDVGGTNYQQVLQQVLQDVQQYITQQINLPQSEQDFPGPIVILFGSDGIPNEGCFDQGCLQTIINQITALPIGMHATQILPYITGGAFGWGQVFTLGPNEQEYLQWVADAFGGGLLIDQLGQPLDLTKLPLPAKQSPQGVNFDLYATNLNGVWDQTTTGGAKFSLDSDGDGISDQQELILGSNPNVVDSDGNHLGDGVEMFVWGTPCQNAGCVAPSSSNPDKRAPINTCKNIPSYEGGGAGYFTNDIMNNCEKVAVGVDYHIFSYLKDNVADGVKVRNFLSPTKTTLGQVIPDNGNLSYIDEIKMNLPTFIPNPLAAGYLPTKYNVQFAGTQGTKSCYSFNIQGLPVVGSKPNHVRLWLTQTQANLPDILRTADIMAVPGQPISITDDEFHPNQNDINAQ